MQPDPMNRLQTEVQRLFLPAPRDVRDEAPCLFDAQGRVRALVIELARPAEWELLAAVWQAVQHDLELPAPAIAVSGTEGLQLWLSLAQPVAAVRAAAFLERLRQRYLWQVEPARVGLFPTAAEPHRHAALVPAEQASGNWSAFVAPGLAPVFADTPWLDIPPGVDGQADLLARLQSIEPAAFDAAFNRLQPAASPPSNPQPPVGRTEGDVDPRQFLQRVLNDETAPLALRVEAAKALLAHTPM